MNQVKIYDGGGSEWYAAVNGIVVGPWPTRQYAEAGAQVELRRQRKRCEQLEDNESQHLKRGSGECSPR